MLDINADIFQQVIEQAKLDSHGDERIIAAIDRAAAMLDGNPYVEMDAGGLLVMSDTSFETYHATAETCECTAREFGDRLCKHSMAADLLRRYNEAVAAARKAGPGEGGLYPALRARYAIQRTVLPSGRVREHCRGIQI